MPDDQMMPADAMPGALVVSYQCLDDLFISDVSVVCLMQGRFAVCTLFLQAVNTNSTAAAVAGDSREHQDLGCFS
jgi:hypothetical protein